MILRVDQLIARAGTLEVLSGVSLDIKAGETLAILGASGSGKSLTGRAMIGLEPRGIAYRGAVHYGGRDLLTLPERERARLRGRELAMVFQEPATALNPVKRIGTQIAEPFAIHTGLSPDERRAKVADLLERTGLAAAGVGPARYPHELSGGQRQRVAVAIAIALEPALIVADEPTSALDTVSAAKVLSLLFRLAADMHTALVLITHDIDVARRAQRIAVMDRGRIAEVGAAETLLRAPQSGPARALVAGTRLELPARSAEAGPAILTAHGVSVTRGGTSAVIDADLSIRHGERLAIVGASGSGKTSLSRALVGLLPASGTVALDGTMLSPRDPALRAAVQMVFQDPATSFNPRHTVERIVTEPLFGSRLSRADKRKRAEAVLARVGLTDVLERKPHAFSGGQRQRIAIARALIAGPRVLIADEAVSALDAALRADVIRLLDTLTRQDGTALVFIAHDLGLVRTVADRIVVMSDGRIVEDRPAAALFSAPQAPATEALLAAARLA